MTGILDGVRDHFCTAGLSERLKTALTVFGPEDQRLTPQQLAGLDRCADPCFRGAKLDPLTRTVAAPAMTAQPGGGGAPLDARLGEAARRALGEEVLARPLKLR